MELITSRHGRLATTTVLVAIFMLGALVAPARAEDRNDHHWDDHHRRDEHHRYYHNEWRGGGYYRAPPVVYGYPGYYPPPVVYGPGVGVVLPGIGINIR